MRFVDPCVKYKAGGTSPELQWECAVRDAPSCPANTLEYDTDTDPIQELFSGVAYEREMQWTKYCNDLQYDCAEWEQAFLRQAREFPFLPLLPREASK